MSQDILISLCICTYNRCDQLNHTLNELKVHQQSFIAGDEILVIDNNSTDGTGDIVAEYLKHLPLLYFFEPDQGLSCARNRGLREFSNDLIIFIDDDITIDTNFIQKYREAFKTFPQRGFFGGKIHVDWGEAKPSWYKATNLPLINGFIGFYDQGEVNKEIFSDSLLPYGANFALRRNVIDAVGEFNPTLGVKGKETGRGEESDYFERALSLGFTGSYIAKAKVYHRFQVERISIKYLYRYGIQKGVAAVTLDAAQSNNELSKTVYQVFAGLFQLLKRRKDRFYQCVINIGIIRGIKITARDNNA